MRPNQQFSVNSVKVNGKSLMEKSLMENFIFSCAVHRIFSIRKIHDFPLMSE